MTTSLEIGSITQSIPELIDQLGHGNELILTRDQKPVAKLKKLTGLSLRYTVVADAGLMKLVGLTKLKSIDVTYSRVTPEGIAAFKAKRPDCELYVGE